MRRSILSPIFVSLALASACAIEVNDPAGGPCVLTADCPSDYVCAFDAVGQRVCLLGRGGQSALDAGEPYFCREVKPLLQQFCTGCHGAAQPDGGQSALRLDVFRSDGGFRAAGEAASDIARSVREGSMPPKDHPLRPSPLDELTLARWAELGAPECLPRDVGYVSFIEDVQPIFNARCKPCHVPGPSGGMSLSNHGRAALLGVRANCDPTSVRVYSGSPEQSALWRKLSGTSCGSQMPLGGPYLTPLEQGRIRRWIEQGALDN